MLSKFSGVKALTVLSGVLMLTGAAGCFLKINETPYVNGDMELEGAEINCLEQAPEVFQKYFDGQLPADGGERISSVLNCANDGLKLFAERTEGAEQGKYTPQELRRFFEKYFLGELRISDDLLREAMELKRAVLGGSADLLTIKEINRLRSILETLRGQLVKVQPFLPLSPANFRQRDASPESQAFVEEATTTLIQAGEVLGDVLQQNASDYSFESYDRLMVALESIYEGEQPKVLHERLPLVRALKSMLVGPAYDGFGGNEWSRFFSLGGRWYALVLRYAYVEKNFDQIAEGKGYELFSSIIDDAYLLLRNAIALHPDRKIKADELERLIMAFTEKELNAKPEDYSALIRPALDLKRSLFGGEADSISWAEVQRVYELTSVVRQQLAQLHPYFPLTIEQMKSLRGDQRFVDMAAATLAEAGKKIAVVLEKSNRQDPSDRDYSISSFKDFLSKLQPIFKINDFDKVIDRMKLFEAVKSIIIAPPSDQILGSQWPDIVKSGARGYGLALRSMYYFENYTDRGNGPGRIVLVELMSDVFSLLHDAINRHPVHRRRNQVIPFEEFDAVIDQMQPEELVPQIPSYLKNNPKRINEDLKVLLRAVIKRAFAGMDRGPEGRDAVGLTHGLLNRAWTGFNFWSEGQRYLEGVYRTLGKNEYGSSPLNGNGFLPEDLRRVSLETAIEAVGDGQGINGITESAARELTSYYSLYSPLFSGDDSKITFPLRRSDFERHSFHNLSDMNWMHQLVKYLVTGYGSNREMSQRMQGISVPDFKVFCDDIQKFGEDIKFMDYRKKDAYTARFREASLFTFASNGDEFLDFEETTQLLAYLMSAKRLANKIHQEMAQHCRPTMGVDIFGEPLINPSCYRERFMKNYARYFDHQPGAAAFIRKLDKQGRERFMRAYEMASRTPPFDEKTPFESSDTEGLSLVMHYIETTYTRFDADHSGTINRGEAQVIYPVFRQQLFQAAAPNGLTKDWQIEALMTYLLNYGEPPAPGAAGTAKFIWWAAQRPVWAFEADRGVLVNIFATIGSMVPPAP